MVESTLSRVAWAKVCKYIIVCLHKCVSVISKYLHCIWLKFLASNTLMQFLNDSHFNLLQTKSSTISNDAKVQRGISRWSYCRTFFFNDLLGHDCEWTLVQNCLIRSFIPQAPDGCSMNAFMPNIWFGCLNSSFLVNPFWFPEMHTVINLLPKCWHQNSQPWQAP